MRQARRLPPLLRVVRIVGLLFFLAAIALAINLLTRGLSANPDSLRGYVIVVNLMWLGSACSSAARSYGRRVDRGLSPTDSWRSQLRPIALLSALPLLGIALALIIPPTSPSSEVVSPLFLAAGGLMLTAFEVIGGRTAGAGRKRPPPTG